MKRFFVLLSLTFAVSFIAIAAQSDLIRIVTAEQSVNVRERPATRAAIVGSLDAGKTAIVIGEEASGEKVSGSSLWYQIELRGDVSGWVWSGAVQLAEAAPTPTPTPRPTLPPNPNYERLSLNNLQNIRPIAQWGLGVPYNVAWSKTSNVVAVGVQGGVLFYDPSDWSLIRRVTDDTQFQPAWLGKPRFEFAGDTLITPYWYWYAKINYELRLYRADEPNPRSIPLRAPVAGMAASPGGKYIALALVDHGVDIYNLETRRGIYEILPKVGSSPGDWDYQLALPLAYSPDGKRFAMVIDGVVTVYDVFAPNKYAVSKEIRITVKSGESVFGPTTIAFNADGTQIVTFGNFQDTRLIDIEAGTYQNVKSGYQLGRTAASPDGDYYAFGTGKLWLIDAATGETIPDLPELLIGDFAFSPDGQQIVQVDENSGLLQVVSVPDLTVQHTMQLSQIYDDADMSADGQTLAVTSGVLNEVNGSHIDLYHPLDMSSSGIPYATITLGDDIIINQIAFSPDGKQLAVGGMSRDGFGSGLRILSLPDGVVLNEYDLGKRNVDTIAMGYFGDIVWSPDGLTLAIGGSDGVVRLWDVATLQPKAVIPATSGKVYNAISDLDYSPDGQLLAVSTRTDSVYLYDADGRFLHTMQSSPWNRFERVAFSPDGQTLTTVGMYQPECTRTSCTYPEGIEYETTLERWDVQTGERLTGYFVVPMAQSLLRSQFSPDETFLLGADAGGYAGFFNTETGERITQRHFASDLDGWDAQRNQAFFSADGALLILINSSEGMIQVYGVPQEDPTPVLFADDFEGGDLHRWVNRQGAGSIVDHGGNHVLRLADDTGKGTIFPLRALGWTDYAFEAAVRIVRESPDTAGISMSIRETTTGAYRVALDAKGGGSNLTAQLNGGETGLDSHWDGYAPGEWVRVRLQASGQQVELYINDRLIKSVKNDSNSAGNISFTVGPNAIVEVDNVRVIPLNPETGETAVTPTPTATLTATPTLIPTLTMTPTALPSSTPTPTPTFSPTPERVAFEETFEDGDISEWENQNSMGSIVSDGDNHILRFQNNSDNYSGFRLMDRSWSDYAVEISVRIESGTLDNTDFFLNLRGDATGGYSATLDVEAASAGIMEGLNGNYPDLGTSIISLPRNEWAKVRIQAVGNQLKLYVNDALVQSATNSDHREGSVSLTVAPHTVVEVDNVRVIDLR
ncbi:MAG: family 16 glycoside hydrolase [Chloroflexota bacterium]